MIKKTIEKAEEKLKRIANVLLLNASFISDFGLFNGKIGIAVFFYHYSRYSGNKMLEDYAGELIDEVYSSIDSGVPVDFTNGLMGIGWGIEHLVNEGFLEADTDEFIKDIDGIVFKASLKDPVLLNDSNELFGFGLYYIARLYGRGNDDHNLNTIVKKQMLVYLHDDCERLLAVDVVLNKAIPRMTLDQLNSLMFFIINMQKLWLFPAKLSRIEKIIPAYIGKSKIKSESKIELNALRYLLDACRNKINDPRLKAEYTEVINSIKPTGVEEEGRILADEIIKSSWYSLVFKIPVQYMLDGFIPGVRLFEIIDNEDNWQHRLSLLNSNNLGLDGGMAGLGMTILNGIKSG